MLFFSASSTVVTVLVLLIMGWSAVWACCDAVSRDKPGWAVALLVLLTWPVGLLVWIVFRPNEQLRPVPSPGRFVYSAVMMPLVSLVDEVKILFGRKTK